MICHVIGDSIAVGTAAAMPECHAQARSGITSTRFVRDYAGPLGGDLVVISLGANDVGLPTLDNLRRLRAAISAHSVVWLLPHIQRAGVRDSIVAVAAEHGDRLVDTAPYAGRDRLHPTGAGYRHIADEVRDPVTLLTQRGAM
jgi:lysophospholipase L1-like esterase